MLGAWRVIYLDGYVVVLDEDGHHRLLDGHHFGETQFLDQSVHQFGVEVCFDIFPGEVKGGHSSSTTLLLILVSFRVLNYGDLSL